MWSDILTGYGIFILEILTILLVIAAIVAMIISAKQRNAAHHGELVVTDLSEEFKETVKHLRDFQLSEEELKQAEKTEKKAKKSRSKDFKSKIKKPVRKQHLSLVFTCSILRVIFLHQKQPHFVRKFLRLLMWRKQMMKSCYV